MRKLLLTMLLLSLIAPFTAQSQNDAVRAVLATTNKESVDLVWSYDDIVPESMKVDFETGDFSQADFVIDQTFPWEITEDAYEGNFAIRSTCEGIGNGVSAIEITVDVPFDATMSFYHKVNSEYYFDNGRFFIDGVERALITGNVDWEYKEFEVKKGVHTYRWTYRKDNEDFEVTQDVYFIDNIVLYEKKEPFKGGWIKYDDDHYVQALGSQSGFIEWGVCFPNTAEYAGFNLTKVALYGENAATIKANVYFGGTNAPETLVTTETFKLKSSKKVEEFELSAPIPVSETEPLWITFSSTDPTFVATMCNFVGNKNSDWVNFGDGKGWQHLTNMDGGAYQYSWIVRGLLENAEGQKTVLTRERNTPSYKVFRKNILTGETKLLAENVADTTYNDATWKDATYGVYSWGVLEGEADTVWSNDIIKDMYAQVDVKVTTNGKDAPAGARVKFVNLTEPEQGFNYKATLDETGLYTFKRLRKGTYKLSVSLEGYEPYAKEVTVTENQNVECELTEIKAAVENLYVSPTGWAMWDNADFDNGGGTFFFDFETGTLDGWTTLDVDNDGLTWRVTTDIMGPGNGYNKSKYCVISQSYCTDSLTPETAALKPDNYLITAEKYLITESSELSYYVCAQDETSPAEHYALLISTTDTDVNSFVTVWEETLSRGAATRNSRGQGAWYKRSIDLSKFAGQEIYVAFRHFNTVGQFYVDVDDIALVNNAKSSSRSINGYTVKLNDKEVAKDVVANYYQFEDLTAGESYKATVIANYTTGESAAAEYTWTYVAPTEYAGAKNVEGRSVAGKALVEWTLEGDVETGEAETSFSFNFSDTTLNGWRSLDADGDGYGWYNSAEKIGPGFGYKDNYCAMSHSFYGYTTPNGNQYNMPLTPDNYLVTEKKYAITESSQLSFLVCALDPEYYAEHYGVAITMVDNASAEDFFTIFEETIENDKLDEWDGMTPQTEWVLRTIDLSKYAGEEVYIAIRHFNCTDQYIINIDDIALTTGDKSARNDKEVLGVMVFCEDELITPEPISKRSLYTDFPGTDEYVYCVRVVYEDYGMSAPQCVLIDAPMECVAPRNLYGESAVNENGQSGVSLTWPFEISDWLSYDNDTPASGFHNNGSPFYYGIMFPIEILKDYTGTSITKVKIFDYEEGSSTIFVYLGSNAKPVIQKHMQTVMLEGTKEWIEIELDKPVAVTGEDHIWVLAYQKGTAVLCQDPENKANGRWVSLNGSDWMDLKTMNSAYKYVWAMKAYVTSVVETERGTETQDFELVINENVNNNPTIVPLDESVVAKATNESALQNYNVYRGTDLNEMELIAEPKEGRYFDVVPAGTYYYQVRAVYKDGEETCVSEPANSFRHPDQFYIVVETLSMDENGIDGMIIYPNPAKDNLTIKAEAMKHITITNTLGQVVYDNEADSDNEVINMSQYDAGVYMLRITTENGSVVRKISKF